MENNRRNYRDDFDFLLKLYSAVLDKDGNEVKGSRRKLGWPDYDWSATMWTNSKANAYTASCTDGKCVNCYNDNGEIHIVVNDHHMGPGTVRLQFLAELPREIYPDGSQRNVISEPVNIELIIGKGDLPTEMEVEMLLPYIKGDPFTYDDFTPGQIAGLQKPAMDAAAEVRTTEKEIKDAEDSRVKAEGKREAIEKRRIEQENKIGTAEQGRQTSEIERRTAENGRVEAEVSRKEAEVSREEAETKRVSAEEKRAEAETARRTAENARIDSEAGRVSAESARSTNEQNRVAAESTRASDEQTRQAAESARQTAEQNRATAEQGRVGAESSRVAAEQSRVSAETARAEAETQRATEFTSWKSEIDSKADRSELSNVIAESSGDEAILKERGTGEVMYPHTLASLVKTADGGNVDEGLASASLKGFDELWIAAGGTVIKSGEIYECNGTDDLSYGEAVNIYGWYAKAFTADCSYRFFSYPYRAMLPIPATAERVITADRMFYWAKNIKVIKFVNTNSSTMPSCVVLTQATAAFMRCDAMREIATPIQFMALSDSAFSHTAALEEVRIYKIAYNISFVNSPLLSLASLQYLVTNAVNTLVITVTVHADVYAKLTGDTTNAAAAALTPEELAQWQQIITDGAAKQISFATA